MVEAPGIEALCVSHKKVLRDAHLAIFLEDSCESLISVPPVPFPPTPL